MLVGFRVAYIVKLVKIVQAKFEYKWQNSADKDNVNGVPEAFLFNIQLIVKRRQS